MIIIVVRKEIIAETQIAAERSLGATQLTLTKDGNIVTFHYAKLKKLRKHAHVADRNV